MVAIRSPSLQLLFGVVVSAATFVIAGRHNHLDSRSVGFSARGYDDESDFSLREYDDEGLSARELSIRGYIDDKLEFALRQYDDQLEELFARLSRQEIAAKIAYYTAQLAITQRNLTAAINARKAAERALKANPTNQALKDAVTRAKRAEKDARGYNEHNQDELDAYKRMTPSPSPGPASAKPKKK